MTERQNVVRGLVPRWGRDGAWQNPACKFAEPTHDSGFSSLGVPAPAGMSDWYENGVTRPGECPQTTAPTLVVPAPIRHSGKAGIQRSGDECNVPRSGWRPPCRVAKPTVPIRRTKPQLRLFIPWRAGPAGMSDCYENRPLRQPLIRHSRHPFADPSSQSIRPAEAGIQKGWGGVRPPIDGKNSTVAPFSFSYAVFARPW